MENPFKRREQLKAPRTPMDLVRAATKEFDDQETLRDKMLELDELYNNTEFAGSLRTLSRQMSVALLYAGERAADQENHLFYYGGLLSLHATMMSVETKAEARTILNTSFANPTDLRKPPSMDTLRQVSVTNLHTLDYIDNEMFPGLSEEDQFSLQTAAILACDSLGRPTEEKQFIRGALYTLMRAELAIGRRLQPKATH